MKEQVNNSINQFIQWQKQNGFSSYDQYDFWCAAYGINSKKIYYKNKLIGVPFVTPIFIAEILCPASRKLFAKKKRFPIADAHFILAYSNLYKYTSNPTFLQLAKEIAEDLLKSSVKGFSGLCWGYPFNWMTTRGLWKTGIPLITTTAYCYEAFIKLYELTKEEQYKTIAYSIFTFTINDLKDTIINENLSSSSYSPIDNSQIVNANAYRSYVLLESYKFFNSEEALKKARSNINFILKSQQKDGSWLYAMNDKRDAFVDNFHTCFVLKNLLKSNKILQDQDITVSIKKGFEFYKRNLLEEDLSPLPFAKLGRVNIVKKELYDYAEGISLCLQMEELDNEAFAVTKKLVTDVVTKYQKRDGSFTTRINIFNIPNNMSYLRWPQSQLFYALTNYLLSRN